MSFKMLASNIYNSGGSRTLVSGGAPIGIGAAEVKKMCYGLRFGPFLLRKIEKFFSEWGRSPPVSPKSATDL